MNRLVGKVAFITGTGGVQGRAAARIFAAEGACVVGCDIRPDRARETLDLVDAEGGTMISRAPVDLSDRSSVEKWIAEGIETFGGLDILYNNAAAARFEPFESLAADDWTFTLRHELDVLFHATQVAWPHLIVRGGGAVINTASTAALHGTAQAGTAAHATGKSGVIGFTRQVAAEGARHRIRVNAISPGPIETPDAKAMADKLGGRIAESIPLGRWGRPEDIAYCALYLASSEAEWVTGANFVVDGGYLNK